MQDSTVTRKGRTTLPKEVRAALGLKAGDRLRYFVLDGAVRIVKVRPAAELAGVLDRPDEAVVRLEDMDAAVASGAAVGSSRL